MGKINYGALNFIIKEKGERMKKGIILISLIAILSSCGGGGGGGSSVTQTAGTAPTPTVPSLPGNTAGTGGTGNKENNNGTTNIIGENNQNLPKPILPTEENKTNNPSVPEIKPQVSEKDTRFPKPTDRRNITGAGVKVGVLDSDFLSNNAYTDSFYTGGLLNLGTEFGKVLTEEFGDRFTAIQKTLDTYSTLSEDDHGLMVATILAGKSGKGAKGASVYGVSFGERGGHLITDKEKYEDLYNRGVRIFNQSFGTALEFSDYNFSNYKPHLYPSVMRESQVNDSRILDRRIDELNNFYKKAVNNGSLFVWAAGNTTTDRNGRTKTYNAPTIQAGMPHYIPELYRGWIAVVGVQPDGREYPVHLARAGKAKWWTISASGDCELPRCSAYGSSFAAPRVTATAVKVKEKFPWMTGHELKQTILTTAKDLGQPGVDSIFGWGLLDEAKALKGPAKFSSELIVGERAALGGLRGQFNANVTDGTSIFENDIDGEGGLKKSGNGTLVLTGNNTYHGSTDIIGGTLEIYGENGSNIDISQNGTLITYPTTMIGLRNGNGTISKVNVQNDGGTFENRGSGAVITGDYIAGNGAVTKAEIGTKLKVNGTVNLNGNNTLQTLSNRYVTAKPVSSTVIEAEKGINGSFNKVETPELINGNVETADNKVNVKLSRKNMVDYVEKIAESDEMQKTTAENLETAFQKLDQNIENGTAGNVAQFERKAAKLQALTSSNRAAVLDSLSGQIYASAQALTFQHSQTVNKDLSNRLVMLGTLDNVGDNFGLWISGFGANGKLKQDGYGKGDTKVAGGQVGVDKQFGENLILGTALSYSKADVKFDRYGGKSDANNFGVSLYGRLGNKNVPFYLQGRFGIGFVDSDVERDIILSNNDFTRAKINHNDKVYSGYLETGYDIKNGNGDFVVTPFVGLTHDTVVRGSFSEEKSQFGLTADKKNYNQTAALLGLRVGKAVNWNGGSKTTFQGYVIHQRAFNDQDLSFDARYTGLPGATFKVKGIGLSKNKTWVGVGALTEVNSGFGWYVNYDGSIDSGKGKGNNNVFTTGVRFNF